MSEILLTNKSLESLIKETPLVSEHQRKEFLDRLSYLDREERIGLLKTLKNVLLIDAEKNQAVKKLREIE